MASSAVPVLMYHRIGAVRKDSIVPGQYVPVDLFRKQIRLLKSLGYRAVSPSEIKWPSGSYAGEGKPFVMSFDDGYADFAEVATPELAELGWSGTVFLVTDCVGGTNAWDEKAGDVTERLMTWDQARSCRAAGMEIGSHTTTHVRLSELDQPSVRRELVESKSRIEAELGGRCDWFCYPYGGMSQSVADEVRSAGYAGAFATTKGAWRETSNPFKIPRINMRADTSVAVLAYKLLRAVALGR